MNGKTIFIAIAALVIGFGSGFVLRPVIVPLDVTPGASHGAGLAAPLGEGRGTQYFEAHLEEAREVVAQCAVGAVRGQECANAEVAIVEAEGKERFDAFMGR
ncbi:hypothetical protein [Sphingobium baderi]|uniref:Uncharacterized protein n=1 Tax=Sphingobium baderi TaxID=1332080 RepID=A0A0S3F4E3_9SPHN|nr:hypothetical protein ATN00_12005 [Sphingobium baderi]